MFKKSPPKKTSLRESLPQERERWEFSRARVFYLVRGEIHYCGLPLLFVLGEE
jgi:hypothetical protein